MVDSSHRNAVARVQYSRAAVKLSSIERSAVTKGLETTVLVHIFQTLTADIKDCLGHP